jgi:NADH-quinone oxidoreductase subunit G
MGLIGRGEDAEITTYLERALTSELQGNVIDLCPVGALTSKPYAFHARPWELVKTESIDVMDAVGSNIRVDVRGREVMRILPRLNEAVNEEWISDKTRFVWDGLRTQRLDRPYVRVAGKLRPASWSEAFAAIAARVKGVDGKRVGAIGGDLASVEDLFALKGLMAALGSPNLDIRQDGAALDPAAGRASYVFNPTIAGIEQADAILIIGANPRREASVLNARIRKRWRAGGMKVGVIGAQVDLTYPHDYLGAGTETLADIAAGKGAFGELLANAKRPIVIVGQSALAGEAGAAVLATAASIASAPGRDEGWNGLAVLHTAASRVGGLDIGFVPGEGGLDTRAMVKAAGEGALDVLFLLGADEIDTDALGSAFVVYVGTHGDNGAHRADVILPAAAYTEKSGTYVNTEGRVQFANRAAFPPGDAREDWAVFRALSEVLGKRLPFDSLAELRRALYAAYPHLAKADHVEPAALADVAALASKAGSLPSVTFGSVVADFYLTNPIARASAVMAECSALAAGQVAAAAE